MPALRFSENEQAALLGLPHAAVALYLWLRARMDFSTGFVGVRPRVSWLALAQDLYVEPRRGPLFGRSSSGRPTIDQVFRLAGVLERAGLVERRSKIEPPQLIFKLPLADTLSFVRTKPAPNPQGEPAPARSRSSIGESIDRPTEPARRSNGKPAPHPVSGVNTVAAAGDNARTYEEPAAAEMVFPPSTPAERRAFMTIARRHALTREDLQLLLDELAGRLRRKREVRNKPALLESMVEQLRRGEFYGLFAEDERGGGVGLSPAEAEILNNRRGK